MLAAGRESRIAKWIGIDFRSLGAFRILFGVFLLCDLIWKFLGIEFFYSDQGIYPRIEAIHTMNKWTLSIFMMTGEPLILRLMFSLAVLASVGFIFGYRIRLLTLFLWIFYVSMHNRNPHLIMGADTLARVLLFWCMFLPLGSIWSIRPEPCNVREQAGNRYLAMAGFCILLQITLVYFFAGLYKDHSRWFPDGTAIYFALNLDLFTSDLGRKLLEYPALMKALSISIFLIELGSPFLVFGLGYFFRKSVILMFVGFHLGLLVTMNLATFPWIGLLIWTLFIPSEAWDSLRVRGAKIRSEVRHRSSYGIRSTLATLFMLLVLVTCALELRGVRVPLALKRPVQITRLDQSWQLFAPFPRTHDGHLLVKGLLGDGQQLDLVTGARFDPKNKCELFNGVLSMPWIRSFQTIWIDTNIPRARRAFVEYFCRQWNDHSFERAQAKVVQVELFYNREKTRPPGQPSKNELISLFKWNCATEK